MTHRLSIFYQRNPTYQARLPILTHTSISSTHVLHYDITAAIITETARNLTTSHTSFSLHGFDAVIEPDSIRHTNIFLPFVAGITAFVVHSRPVSTSCCSRYVTSRITRQMKLRRVNFSSYSDTLLPSAWLVLSVSSALPSRGMR